MRKFARNRKALSPVVAAIILIAVTVAVSIAVAAWMGAITIGFMKTEELKIISVEISSDLKSIIVTARNVGTANIVITDVKVNDEVIPSTAFMPTSGDVTVAPGTSTAITVAPATTPLISGTTYNIALVTKAGNVFTYRATAPS